MSSSGKKLFLVITIVVPMIIYCYVYYKPIIQNAPFRKDEFVSMEYHWGLKDTLENHYYSTSGEYEFLNTRDSLIKKTVRLNNSDILTIHYQANELGLWNFPDTIGRKSKKSMSVPRYEMIFNYKRKSKHVVIYSDFDGNPKLMSSAVAMRKAIETQLALAEKRSGK
ncbi:hypothetical protein [Pedobacter sp. MW01-1-1]|uniref:hypothetical protein n=1 Tax=Pedobacter sp. MW01-1-1 TaxID=3383027 RepID=UPI003FEEFDE2